MGTLGMIILVVFCLLVGFFGAALFEKYWG